MTEEQEPQAGDPDSSDDSSDTALLEEALRDAIEAHAAGLLAAPFGVDAVALARARRRAAQADAQRQRLPEHPSPDSA